MGKAERGRGPVRIRQRMAGLLVVVLAGVLAFAPGLAGVDSAVAGSVHSYLGSSAHQVGSAEHVGEKSHEGATKWVSRVFGPFGKARASVRSRWQKWRNSWHPEQRYVAATQGLEKDPAGVLVKVAGWFSSRWWLLTKDEHGNMSVIGKNRLDGRRSGELFAKYPIGALGIPQGQESQALTKVFGRTGRIERVIPQTERFAEVVTELKALEAWQWVDIVERSQPSGWQAGLYRNRSGRLISSWRITKRENGWELARQYSDAVFHVVARDLSIPQVTVGLAESFAVDSRPEVIPRYASSGAGIRDASDDANRVPLASWTAPWRRDWYDARAELGGNRAVRSQKDAIPSWGGKFPDRVGMLDELLSELFNHGRKAYLELLASTKQADDIDQAKEHLDQLDQVNDPSTTLRRAFLRRLYDDLRERLRPLAVGGYDQYGITNLGGGRIRVIDVRNGGVKVAEGGPDNAKVQEWFRGLPAHIRFALKPDTGRYDLGRIELAFQDRVTGLVASLRHHFTPPYPINFVSKLSLGGVLMPRGALTPEVFMLVRDQLLQSRRALFSFDPRTMVGGEEALRHAFTTDAKKVAVSELVKRADEVTGVQVLGLAKDENENLLTVAVVDRQLVLYDLAGNLRDHAHGLLEQAKQELTFLSTRGKKTHLPSAGILADLSGNTAHWTFVPRVEDTIGLAEGLSVGQVIDIIHVKSPSPANDPRPSSRRREEGAKLYPEFFRITRESLWRYKVTVKSPLRSEEVTDDLNLVQLQKFLRPEMGEVTYWLKSGMFVRRSTPGGREPVGVTTGGVDPYHAWEIAWPPNTKPRAL